MDPATKQYTTFAAILSLIFSFIVNFVLIDFIRGTILYGFPFNLGGAEGFGMFILRVLNTVIVAFIFTFPFFYMLKELNRRR